MSLQLVHITHQTHALNWNLLHELMLKVVQIYEALKLHGKVCGPLYTRCSRTKLNWVFAFLYVFTLHSYLMLAWNHNTHRYHRHTACTWCARSRWRASFKFMENVNTKRTKKACWVSLNWWWKKENVLFRRLKIFCINFSIFLVQMHDFMISLIAIYQRHLMNI